jgi:ferric-dicitrate binding protein FerR (iron transport regulator)
LFGRSVLICLLLAPGAALASEGAAGRWTVVQGRVTVSRVGQETPVQASEGGAVAVGDLLETGKDGRAQALLADDTVVNLSSGTSLRILQYRWDAARDSRTAIVKVLGGKARFIVAGRAESLVSVETAQASISARAADFVTQLAPEETLVAVLDGGVSVKNGSALIVERVSVQANQASLVRSKAAPTDPASLTPQQRKAYHTDARHF